MAQFRDGRRILATTDPKTFRKLQLAVIDNQQASPAVPASSTARGPDLFQRMKTPSTLLRIAIVLLPFVFAWLAFHKVDPPIARVAVFGWLLVCLLAMLRWRRH